MVITLVLSQKKYRFSLKHCAGHGLLSLVMLSLLCTSVGCQAFRQYGELTTQPGIDPNQPVVPNPLVVPMMDRWAVMDQVSDEIEDYFEIDREERIALHDGIMSEGWIETHPKIGGTLLEPWRRDSTLGFERLHATLQTVRRFSKIRVIPSGNSYQIDVKVFKELEDLPQPLGSSVGGQLLRYDSALDIDRERPLIEGVNKGWIPMGRDLSLEQTILQNISSRISNHIGGLQVK